jgi:hypothetical protein
MLISNELGVKKLLETARIYGEQVESELRRLIEGIKDQGREIFDEEIFLEQALVNVKHIVSATMEVPAGPPVI